jgi:hypothetical protein
MSRHSKILGIVVLITVVVVFFAVKKLTQQSIQSPSITPIAHQVYTYYIFTVSTQNPYEEITKKFGAKNVLTILKINRIDSQFIKKGDVLIISNDMTEFMHLSPFPYQLSFLVSIPKVLLFSQRVQAFGVYEYGELKRWGPISSGKESTPTPKKLYFANWKSKESISSVDSEWILRWNFNLDNLGGVDMHEYELPGYPASHSCVRMFGTDAKWIYDWADQWHLSKDEKTFITYGTPVIVFGDYVYNQIAPWKNLALDSNATNLTKEEIEKEVTLYVPEILEKQKLFLK